MIKAKLLASTLGLVLLAGPALAQQAASLMRHDMPMQSGVMPALAPAPAQTGPGQTMRDGGLAGSMMSRADAIIRVQSSGSGGLSGSTPGSPGVGNQGSTPQGGMGTMTQPPQGGANRGSGMGSGTGTTGTSPSAPGVGTPQQGSGRSGLGGTTIQPGGTPGGGGTSSNPTR